MNVTESNDTSTVLRAAVEAGAILPGDTDTLDAAARLADRAHDRLLAGPTGTQLRETVRRQWRGEDWRGKAYGGA